MIEVPLKLPLSIVDGSFGIPVEETQVAQQMEVYKELVNKLAWALGSTYGRPYANRTMAARQLAMSVAQRVVDEVGWPRGIEKKK